MTIRGKDTLPFKTEFRNRLKRAQFIQQKLQEIYPHIDIPLKHESPFMLLVAVILSAQCTDARVNQVIPVLFKRAPTPETMQNLPVETIGEIIRPCGFFRVKARYLQKCAHMITTKFSGHVPQTFEELEQLPGVGHKTASVMIAQCFGGYAFPVDTHIHRLANRWGLSQSDDVKVIERDLKTLFAKKDWHDLHIQLVQFGREYCPARGHKISNCPICSTIFSKCD